MDTPEPDRLTRAASRSRSLGRAVSALALVVVLVPNSHHVLLPGIPLSLLGSAALVLALTMPIFSSSQSRRYQVMALAFFAVVLLLKSLVAIGVPARGFRGEYLADSGGGAVSQAGVDREIAFGPRTFRLEFLNDREFWPWRRPETMPFSAEWRGSIWLSVPTRIVVETAASEPLRVAVDGGVPPDVPLEGGHEIVVKFARATPAPPAATAAIRTAEGKRPVAVFADRVAAPQARVAAAYTPISVALDALVLLLVAWPVARGLVRASSARDRGRFSPSLAVTGFAVVAFWFTVGAIRTAPHWSEVEFLTRGDDWLNYEALARAIAAGDLLGGRERTFSSSFVYPYWIAALHRLFGEPLWPVYFGQYVVLGLACVALGCLGRALWGERVGTGAVLAAAGVGVLDVSRWYPVRLLSENLALLVVPVTLLAIDAFVRRPRVRTGLLAGALVAAAVLTRFNLLPFGVLAVGYLLWRSPAKTSRAGRRAAVALLGAFVLVYGIMPLRELLASGAWALLPASSLNTFVSQPGSLGEQWRVSWLAPLTGVVLPNLAFMAGYTKLYAPVYSLRPHWAALWLVYLWWLWTQRGRVVSPTIVVTHLYLFLYVGVMSVNAYIGGYGYRYLLPMFFVLVLFLPAALRGPSKA